MKKLLALVLSLVMALSLIPTVWGTELDDVFAQLWEAGYRTPETKPDMNFPESLVEGVDYETSYVYDETFRGYILTITVKKGLQEHWEKAYQDVHRGSLMADIFMPKPDMSKVVRSSKHLDGNDPKEGELQNHISGEGISYWTNDQMPRTPATDTAIAAYNERDGFVTITPAPTPSDMYYLMRYDEDTIDNNGNETKWMIRYRVVKEEDFSYEFEPYPAQPVDESRIEISDIDLTKWNYTVSNGLVTLQALGATQPDGQYAAHYRVFAPTGYVDSDGNDVCGGGIWAKDTTLYFDWYKNGQLYREKLNIVVQPSVPYMKGACVPVTNLVVPELSGGGVTVAYDPFVGMYHTTFSAEVIPTVEELTATMQMPVPEGAESYRCYTRRTDRDPRIFSSSDYLASLRSAKIRSVADTTGYVLPIANVGKVELSDKHLTKYFAESQYYNIRVIQWYSDAEGTEALGEPVYVFGYNDSFAYDIRTESSETINEAVTAPTLIGQTGLTLVSTRYPQESSGNTLYIELSASGDVRDSNVVYLPYSYFDGLSYDLAVERNLPDPVIHHYNEACSEYTDIQGKYTEYGIKFTTPSFSPFTVTCAPLRGDVNGDGKEPDITDVACLYEQLLTGGGDTKWEGKMLDAALDVNGDGQADVYDLQRLYEYVSGIDSKW